jgi:Kef-type K+ transport system membrane component KefB
VSEVETKYLLFFLFGLGGLAVWAGSEAILPAYVIGMVLTGTVGKDHFLIRRLRTLTFGLLTPFYFIRLEALSRFLRLSQLRLRSWLCSLPR